jgi:hypothetical protein
VVFIKVGYGVSFIWLEDVGQEVFRKITFNIERFGDNLMKKFSLKNVKLVLLIVNYLNLDHNLLQNVL